MLSRPTRRNTQRFTAKPSKNRKHMPPFAGCVLTNRGFPARFTVENRAIPTRILAKKTIAYLPFAIYLALFMVGDSQAKLKPAQLSEIGLQAVLHIVCV